MVKVCYPDNTAIMVTIIVATSGYYSAKILPIIVELYTYVCGSLSNVNVKTSLSHMCMYTIKKVNFGEILFCIPNCRGVARGVQMVRPNPLLGSTYIDPTNS